MSAAAGTADAVLRCPECGSEELEMRGERRVYATLVDGQVDGWNEGEISWDADANGADLIFCFDCDCEFARPAAAAAEEPRG